MIKELLGEWLEERRKRGAPPLPSDATIYIMAFVEWADKQADDAKDDIGQEKRGSRGPYPDDDGGDRGPWG
jgi:hypothetical protein